MSKVKKPGYWKGHMQRWKESGLSREAYCVEAELSLPNFTYQCARMERRQQNGAGLRFIEQRPQSVAFEAVSKIQLLLPNGIRIGIEGEPNAAWLQCILTAACEVSC